MEDACSQGYDYNDIAVFGRSSRSVLDDVEKALAARQIPQNRLESGDREKKKSGTGQPSGVRVGTMHRAKGLEFKIVFVAGAEQGLLPHTKSLPDTKDVQLLEEAVRRERQLLYVSVTRARNAVFITWAGKPSPFLEPLLSPGEPAT